MTENHVSADSWVLITGGSRGIGRGLVRELAGRGYRVHFTYRSAEDQARSIEHEVANLGGNATGYRIDGTDKDAVAAFANRIVADHGAPFAIINNAGITKDGLFLSAEADSWHDVLSNNVDAMFHMTRSLVPAMVEEKRGVILQMSSITAIRGNAGQTNYGASKAAMIGFTRSLAVELARFNIRVNALLPGLIATEMVDQMSEAARKAIKSQVPLRRLGTIEEIAATAAFLLSDGAAYITGQSIVIDGGLSA